MEAHEYRTLAESESSYWWFRELRAILVDCCRRAGLGPSSRILDAGCGTGKTLEVLSREVSEEAYGFDVSAVAAPWWPQRRLPRMCVASVNAVPFRDGSFDAVLGVDVLECDGVDDRQACRELLRVLRPGGCLIVVVPAYRWLMSPEHHRAVQASRRYTRKELRALLEGLPGRVVRMTHLFMSVLAPVAAYRLWRRAVGWRGNGRPHSELRLLPRPVDALLFRASDWERRLLAGMDLPFGSSLLAVVQKAAV